MSIWHFFVLLIHDGYFVNLIQFGVGKCAYLQISPFETNKCGDAEILVRYYYTSCFGPRNQFDLKSVSGIDQNEFCVLEDRLQLASGYKGCGRSKNIFLVHPTVWLKVLSGKLDWIGSSPKQSIPPPSSKEDDHLVTNYKILLIGRYQLDIYPIVEGFMLQPGLATCPGLDYAWVGHCTPM